jgi:molybdopterin molybdotransferase
MALTPVDEALAAVLEGVVATEPETVSITAARGRVLAADLRARRTQPPFAAAAMDGWAIRAADATAPGARLRVAGEAAAGAAFTGTVEPGTCVRIFTGAPLPAGADTVVMQEYTSRDGDTVTFEEVAKRGRHIRAAGVDFHEGDVGPTAGTRLDFTNLGLVAAMNHAEVPVRRRPRIAVLATGDELVPPGATPGPDQIIASNGYAITALIEAVGGEAIDLGIVRDDLDATIAAIRAAFDLGVEVLVTIGGASVGDRDHVHAALAAAGVEFGFWKLAMRPGKPLMFGRRGSARVVGLPGNPSSALVCSLLFLAPLVRALSGVPDPRPRQEIVALGRAVAANDARQDYMRAHLVVDADGRLTAVPADQQDSSLLTRFAATDGLLVRPPHAPAAEAGEPSRFIRFP